MDLEAWVDWMNTYSENAREIEKWEERKRKQREANEKLLGNNAEEI